MLHLQKHKKPFIAPEEGLRYYDSQPALKCSLPAIVAFREEVEIWLSHFLNTKMPESFH